MRHIALLALVVAMFIAGCGNKETNEQGLSKNGENAPVSETTSQTPPAEPDGEAAKPSEAAKSPSGWVKLNSGLQYKDTKVGTGAEAKSGAMVTVHYKGWLDNGEVFDTSRKPDRQAFSFNLGAGQVIPGWEQGVPGMKVGGKRELKIPANLGYGDMEQPTIPANSTLHFEVELLQVD